MIRFAVQPDPRLSRHGDYIHQEVELCPWGCEEVVLLREWLHGRPKQTIVKVAHEVHRETCTAYHDARILLEEEQFRFDL